MILNDAKQIPETVKEFRYENVIIKITKSKTGSVGLVIKNIEWENHHFTFVVKDGKITMHQTDEGSKNKPKVRQDIDFEKVMRELAKLLGNIFKEAEKLDSTDLRFLGKRSIMLTGTNLFINELKTKKVTFDQDLDYDDTLFENIDTAKNSFGVILDDNDDEIATIFVNNGDIYWLDFEKYALEEYQFDSLMKPAVIE